MSINTNTNQPPDLINNSKYTDKSLNNNSIKLYPDNININNNNNNSEGKSSWHWFQVSTVCAIRILLFIIAASLAWNCNKNETMILRIIISWLAGTFSEFYIVYYAVYRVYLGNKCPI